MVKLMSNYVSSPTWMGVLVFIFLVVMIVGIPVMCLTDDDIKSDIASRVVIVFTIVFVGFIGYGAVQQQIGLKEQNFTVARYGDTLHVTSDTPWLQSKEFTIHSENDDFVYIKDKELYEIKKSEYR